MLSQLNFLNPYQNCQNIGTYYTLPYNIHDNTKELMINHLMCFFNQTPPPFLNYGSAPTCVLRA